MPRVSVIVPTFEPGPPFDDLMASLTGQTLPAAEVEVLLVDDGSGDDTPQRLAALAARHPNVHVERIEHSGWPSRPRNTGLDRATGEFVFFADQDDRLDPEALERLVARAQADGADVVLGKVVGHGRGVAAVLFEANRTDATLEWPPLVRLLTPHKLFRRAFLEEHGIRFPDDGVRLEDHVFGLSVYFAGARVSVLADHPVYHWIRHGPGENASFRRMDPASYYGRIRQLLDLIDAHVPPGPVRDRLYTHYLRSKLLARESGSAILDRSSEHQRAVHAAVRELLVERFPPELEDRLPLRLRRIAQLVRADDQAALMALARFEAGLRAEAVLVRRRRRGEVVDLRLEAALHTGDGPLTVRMAGIRLLADALGEQVDLADAVRHAEARVSLRSAADGASFPLPCRHTVRLDPVAGTSFAPVVVIEATVDPRTAASGAALRPGRWHLRATVLLGGFDRGTDRFARRAGTAPARRVAFQVGPDGRLPARRLPSRDRGARAWARAALPPAVQARVRGLVRRVRAAA